MWREIRGKTASLVSPVSLGPNLCLPDWLGKRLLGVQFLALCSLLLLLLLLFVGTSEKKKTITGPQYSRGPPDSSATSKLYAKKNVSKMEKK